jgi:hypothetical protein
MTKKWLTVAIGILTLSAGLAAQKPNTTTPVALAVVVDDVGTRITSDAGGPYVDGQDGVAANIDKYGNLIINFQTGKTPVRKLYYNYDDPQDGQTLGGDLAPPNNYVSTIRQEGDTTKMQDLAVGQSQCVRANVTYTTDDEKTQFRVLFQRGVTGIDVEETAYLHVTRTANETDGRRTWTVDSESTSGCDNGYSGIARLIDTPLVGKFKYTDRGRYHMPFRLFLTER